MASVCRYKAFISYSHTDKVQAKRLFRSLENYRLPRHLRRQVAGKTEIVPTRVGTLFRDREELPAAEDLTAEVKKALTESEFMIVLCSPDAAASRWVNREIIEFKKLNGEGKILSVILSGEPFATDKGQPGEECFPPALRFRLAADGRLTTTPAEPLAADMRPGGDGYRRAVLKLVAGLLGIGLDALIERDLQRKMRRVTAVTAASLIAVLGMGALTYEAITARKAAEHHRNEAEGLIEFMLTDLKDKLEEVGRLDVLDAVGDKAVTYYEQQPIAQIPTDSLGRRARAFHLLGEVEDLQGHKITAGKRFWEAYQTTNVLLGQRGEDQSSIFNHSQSAFWLGYYYRSNGEYEKALGYIKEYAALAQQLTQMSPNNDWTTEYAYAQSSLGTLYLRNLFDAKAASTHFAIAERLFTELATSTPHDPNALENLSDAYAWVADTYRALGDTAGAIEKRLQQIRVLDQLATSHPENIVVLDDKSTALLGLARLYRREDKLSQAITHLETAADICKTLVARDDSNQSWIEQAAVVYLFLADTLLTAESLKRAEAALEMAKIFETKLFSNGEVSRSQELETRIWRKIVSLKLLVARGSKVEGSRLLSELHEEISSLAGEGRTPARGIPLRTELVQVVNEIRQTRTNGQRSQ